MKSDFESKRKVILILRERVGVSNKSFKAIFS